MKNPNLAKISKTTTCGGAETIVGSMGDLLTQIFVHLPLKPLFRFNLVSKQWKSIISDPKFQILLVKEHNNNRETGIIFQKINHRNDPPLVQTSVVSFDGTTNPLPQKIVLPKTLRIFHSCNGLLVLKSTPHAGEEQDYYVYNPTTKQITPPLLKDDDEIIKSRERDRVVGMYLAFDPTKSPHYKVVCVWKLDWTANVSFQHQYQFEVYSSETGSWEIRGWYNFSTTCNVNFENNGVYWNGAIHWLDSFNEVSIYFNPDHNAMPRIMPRPPIKHWVGGCCFYGESCGHLHFAVVGGGDNHLANGIHVYEMMRDYSEWFLKYKVDNDSSLNIDTVSNIYSVVRGNKDKDEDSFLVMGNYQGEIVRYNLVHKTCETTKVKAFDFYGFFTNAFLFFESPCAV